MAKNSVDYVSPFQTISFTDSQGRKWILENGESCQSLEEQKIVKENIPLQAVIANSRTLTQLDGIYDKLSKAKTSEDVTKLLFRAISWCNTENFRIQTFINLLEEKKSLSTDENYLKLIKFAENALRQNGAIPKKLKVAYCMATKQPETPKDEDD